MPGGDHRLAIPYVDHGVITKQRRLEMADFLEIDPERERPLMKVVGLSV